MAAKAIDILDVAAATTCGSLSMSLDRVSRDDAVCSRVKQQFFGRCCNLFSLVEEEDGREAPSPGGLATPNEERPAGESGQGTAQGGASSLGPGEDDAGPTTGAHKADAYWVDEIISNVQGICKSRNNLRKMIKSRCVG